MSDTFSLTLLAKTFSTPPPKKSALKIWYESSRSPAVLSTPFDTLPAPSEPNISKKTLFCCSRFRFVTAQR